MPRLRNDQEPVEERSLCTSHDLLTTSRRSFVHRTRQARTAVILLLGLAALGLSASVLQQRQAMPPPISLHFAGMGKDLDELLPSDGIQISPITTEPTQSTVAPAATKRPIASSQVAKNETQIENLHIAFIGDSITRFMYYHLAFYLRWGRWYRDEERPFLDRTVPTKAFNKLFRFVNELLSPYETCDCIYGEGGLGLDRRENHYFYDDQHNNSITFIARFGSIPSQGGWAIDEVHKMHALPKVYNESAKQWSYKKTADIISQYLVKLEPRPEFVVINEGLWTDHNLNVEELPNLIQALNDANMKGIYRTTTWSKNKRSIDHEEAYCRALTCMNVSWTANYTDRMVDRSHFRSSINRMFSEQLLTLLK